MFLDLVDVSLIPIGLPQMITVGTYMTDKNQMSFYRYAHCSWKNLQNLEYNWRSCGGINLLLIYTAHALMSLGLNNYKGIITYLKIVLKIDFKNTAIIQ